MKTKIYLVVAIALILTLFIPGAVQAAAGPALDKTYCSVSFPDSINFIATAHSDVNITDVRFSYTVERRDFAHVTSEAFITFNPAKTVTAQYILDMKKTGGFPPGTILDYWWTFTDANGNRLVTTSQPVQFNDTRFTWHTLKQGMVTFYWYEGDNAFASDLMATVQSSLGRLSENTGAELQSDVKIYIYASSNDLLGALIYPQDWTGGLAFYQYGTIAIGIGTDAASVAWGKGAIPHELTHLVVHQVIENPYNDLPTWLDEGLAMYSEGALDQTFVAAFNAAEKNGTLFSVRSLTSPFSAYADQSYLAYAESDMIVTFILEKYGRQKMKDMLNLYHDGTGYDDALNKIYGFDMDGLNRQWQASLITGTAQ
jgi:hypothetical protein